MSYENAPSTKMLAVYCCACAKPLRDAISVELGIGPDCRRKYLPPELDGEPRKEANTIVHNVAVAQTGLEVAMACNRLRALGFDKLAARIEERVVNVVIAEEGDRLVVTAPYNPEALPILRAVPGRRWDPERKVNTFPNSSKAALFGALQQAYPGAIAKGSKGPFTIPGTAVAQ